MAYYYIAISHLTFIDLVDLNGYQYHLRGPLRSSSISIIVSGAITYSIDISMYVLIHSAISTLSIDLAISWAKNSPATLVKI